jgi:hypothetical protein
MIPSFDEYGNLPPGEHAAPWPEIIQRFCHTPHRWKLAEGLRAAAVVLKYAGCQILYVNGSFTTAKRVPKDYDACWDTQGVDLKLLDPVLMMFANDRVAQKAKYLGELFPAGVRADLSGRTYLQFFKTDRDTGKPKGIILLDLRSLT